MVFFLCHNYVLHRYQTILIGTVLVSRLCAVYVNQYYNGLVFVS